MLTMNLDTYSRAFFTSLAIALVNSLVVEGSVEEVAASATNCHTIDSVDIAIVATHGTSNNS